MNRRKFIAAAAAIPVATKVAAETVDWTKPINWDVPPERFRPRDWEDVCIPVKDLRPNDMFDVVKFEEAGCVFVEPGTCIYAPGMPGWRTPYVRIKAGMSEYVDLEPDDLVFRVGFAIPEATGYPDLKLP